MDSNDPKYLKVILSASTASTREARIKNSAKGAYRFLGAYPILQVLLWKGTRTINVY